MKYACRGKGGAQCENIEGVCYIRPIDVNQVFVLENAKMLMFPKSFNTLRDDHFNTEYYNVKMCCLMKNNDSCKTLNSRLLKKNCDLRKNTKLISNQKRFSEVI